MQGQIEQLELQLDELATAQAEPPAASPTPEATAPAAPGRMPARRPLPGHLRREKRTILPKETACPDCGGALKALGEDVSEILEYVPAHFHVIQQVRPKLACTHCDKIVQAEAPSRPIARGLAGPGLLAHVLVSKYCDHLPLYRQEEIYARVGVELERTTLADWVGGASQLLAPLVEELRRHVMAAAKLHADDTPVPVLRPAWAERKRGDCGPMFGMTGPPGTPRRPGCGSRTRPIARASIPKATCATSRARCRPTGTRDSTKSMRPGAFARPLAGRTLEGNSTIFRLLISHRLPRKLVSVRSGPS